MMTDSAEMEEQLSTFKVHTNAENSNILRLSIIDHVVMNAMNSDFKNQQINQSELSVDEKRKIAESILDDGHSKFLYIFGEYLIEDHLKYFKSENENNYETNFHLHRLSRLINSKKVVCKNRRYQAMLELLRGDYFSDNEMRNREPLLWEQLVGQYLSEEEKFHYDNQYVAQNSLTEVLFEQIDRDNRDDLKRKQQIEEVHKLDEIYESDDDDFTVADDNVNVNAAAVDDDNDDDDAMLDESSVALEVSKPSSLWGEYNKPKNQTVKIGKRRWKKDHFLNQEPCRTKELSENEKILLLNEFKSHMIHKFLSGQEDYDYNNVDNNPEYDNLHIMGIDEEEKYFDSETVEEIPITENDIEDDELDTYMRLLKKNEITDCVTDKFKKL